MEHTSMIGIIDGLKKARPTLDIPWVNTYDDFRLHKQFLEQNKK